MIHRCATCPFWKQNAHQIVEQNDLGQCSKAEDIGQELHRPYPMLLGVRDEDDEFVTTRIDFGCVLHPENKEVSMSKTVHVSMSVRGALRNKEWLSTLPGNYFRDGKKLTDPDEIFNDLCDHFQQGHEVIPFGEACDNYDWKTGCKGHVGEKDVTIDGLILTNAEVMTLRVAVSSLLVDMSEKNALGDDSHAAVMRAAYLYHARRIEKLLVDGAT